MTPAARESHTPITTAPLAIAAIAKGPVGGATDLAPNAVIPPVAPQSPVTARSARPARLEARRRRQLRRTNRS